MRSLLLAALAVAFSVPAVAQTSTAVPADTSAYAAPANATVEPVPLRVDPLAAAELNRREQRATFYGILIPGTGHLYAGETGRGLTLLTLGVGVPVAASLATGVTSFGCSSRYGCDDLDSGSTVFLAAAIVGTAAWAYSWIDADNAVRRVSALDRVQAAPAVVTGEEGPAPALAVRVRL